MELDSSRLIQELNFLKDDLAGIKGKIDLQDDKFLILFRQMTTLLRNVNKLQKKKTNRGRSSQSKGKKSKAKEGMSTDLSNLLHLQKALQQSITRFTKEFLFKPTFIPDRLLEEDCLSDNEHQTICARESPVDQTRMLIRKIKGRGPETINKFLDIIKNDFPQLEEAVRECYDKNIESSKQHQKCAICILTTTVDPKDIADHLWEAGLIHDDLYSCIIESDGAVSRLALWDVVIQYINQAKDPTHAKNTLEESLKQKYDHLVQALSEHKDQHAVLMCSCRSRRLHGGTSVGSQTDCSSAPANVPYFVYPDSQTTSESETFSSVDEKFHLRNLRSDVGFSDFASSEKQFNMSLFSTRSSDHVGVGTAVMSPDSTVPDSGLQNTEQTRDRSRHSSGKFQPQDNEQCISGHFPSLPFVSPESSRYSEEQCHDISYDEVVNKRSGTPTLNLGAGDTGVSSSTDVAHNTSDTTITPDTDKRPSLTSDGAADTSGAQRKSSDQEKLSPDVYLPKFKLALPKSKVYRTVSYSSSEHEDDELNNDDFFLRTRHKKMRKKLPRRQFSVPVDCKMHIITNSRSPTESTVGTRKTVPQTGKAARKRSHRRMRSEKKMKKKFWDPEKKEFSASVPATQASNDSPEQSREPCEPRQQGKLDHHPGKTYWVLAQLKAASGMQDKFHSDADLRTEDSDALAQTDDNTV